MEEKRKLNRIKGHGKMLHLLCRNDRGIALLDVIYKEFALNIKNRLNLYWTESVDEFKSKYSQ